ncbi:MAG: ethanolamine utilization protein EutM [Rhizobiales bacterium 65-9]|nr:penicillin-binding protein activator [Hyphomicrobiales bacterium]OJY36059.1 MAG: ethanolamine utilization protein EutM [Rhizobiales bacterium 65-9]
MDVTASDVRPSSWATRRRILGAVATGLLTSACGGTLGSIVGGEEPRPAPAPSTGGVKVGLILPLTGGGATGTALKNAAELSLAQFENPNVQLIVKDDRASPEGARVAAQEAINEGAEILLGPLFAANVQAAAQVARAAGRPIIAFSSDSTVASRGVYLLSFLPENEVERIVEYAYSQGKRSFAALIPDDAYGAVANAAFQNAVSRRGARLAAVQTFPTDRARIQAAVQAIAPVAAGPAAQADALFIPTRGDLLPAIAEQLGAINFNASRVRPLGTGQWNEAAVFRIPQLQGGWFAAPDPAGFDNFAQRYRARYNASPTRIATLAYDATSLTVALARTQGARRFSDEVLTNPSGFSGSDGLFRFYQNGANERALAVNEIRNGQVVVLSPAPKSFAS